MKGFMDYVLRFGKLDLQQFDLLAAKANELSLSKDEYFLQPGRIARQFGFLLEGIARVSYYNDEGTEITKYFIEENNILVDLVSFDNEIPSVAFVRAVTDCRLIIFEKQDWQNLLDTIPGWDKIVHRIISKALLQKVERISPLVTQDATTRYLNFLNKYPDLVNRIPLSYIASYLGITQSSLSRIRKSIR